MIDHTGLTVSNYAISKAFYAKALAPIGYQLIMEFTAQITGSTDVAGFGVPPKPDFWVCLAKARLIRRCKSDPATSRSGRKHKERSRR